MTLALLAVRLAAAAPDAPAAAAPDADPVAGPEARLAAALREPMAAGLDVEVALTAWFDGRRAAERGDAAAADAAWTSGLARLTDLRPLPPADWGPNPTATLAEVRRFRYPDTDGTTCSVVRFEVDGLCEYAVLMLPAAIPVATDPGRPAAGPRYPLLLYLHGQAFGVPTYALPWLARLCRSGYAIIGPALRGENLFVSQRDLPPELDLVCQGHVDDLDGEARDAIAAAAAARQLPGVDPGRFGIVAHSFGAGVGLLACARSPDVACMVSYDAWFTNPFRFYWERLSGGENQWFSWEAFGRQPVPDQLRNLMRRSIVHHADRIACPLLLFIGGGYSGSVYHQSHADLVARLRQAGRDVTYDEVPGGNHVFVLDYDSAAARYAWDRHLEFLRRHLPPRPPPADTTPPVAPTPPAGDQPQTGPPP